MELGGEFMDGVRLEACVAFALGSVLACTAAIRDGQALSAPEIRGTVLPDDRRFGWFLDRRAFGCDLYAEGRAAILPVAGGGTVTAQSHLEGLLVCGARCP